MDSHLPEISVTAKRDEKEEEKKHSGLLGLLHFFGKGSSSFSGALGGAGLGGGLLATKAGLVAMILVGSTLAGGLGMIGYKLFGPGASDRGDAKFTSLFAEKPKEQQEAEARAAAGGDSASLSDLAKANAGALGGPQQPGAAGEAAPTDKAKQDAAAIAAAASAATPKGKDNNTNVGGNKGTALKSDKKIGELSKLGAAAGGGSSASFSNAAGPQHGRLSGFSQGPSATAGKGSSRRAKIYNGVNPSAEQLLAQSAVGTKVSGMGAAGPVFDGSTGGSIGGLGSALGGAGTQGGAAANSPTNTPGTASTGDNRFAPPPKVVPTNVTPWQAAINTAVMAVAAAAMLLYFTAQVAKTYGKMYAYLLAGIAAALGAFVMYLGSMIGGSFYGQPLQGQMFEMAGGAIIATAGAAALGVDEMADKTKGGNPTMLMYMCGALALGATAVAYLTPPRSVPSTDFKNGFPPDWDNPHPAETSQGTGHP